jgi:spore coat polysaccharide biosynthesis predicted glycosyltransferase SpsG
MRFVFRADASLAIGSGHVMRSSAIAEEVIARGIPTVFVGSISELPWVSERIQGLGFIDILDEPSNFRSDSIQDILILDSYEMRIKDSFVQPSKWRTIVSIFDESTPQYQCDLRVHPGLTTVWPQFSGIRTISGPTYTPLRKTINTLKPSQEKKNLEIVVVGGGADVTDFVLAIATVLLETKTNFNANLFIRDGKTLEIDLDERFSINPIGKSLDEIANKADLVFTTASTTSLEFLARGTTVAIGCAVDNQELYYKELSDGNYAAPIGEFLNNKWNLDIETIQDLVYSELLRTRLKANSTNLIDLDGSKRIVDEILKL